MSKNMKMFLRGNVYDAALKRIRWVFDEFNDNVHVSFSGGKDSTVVMELAAKVARERGKKLKVFWLDQECEFEGTVDYVRSLKERPDIDFYWFQIPFRLFNATDHMNQWLNVWGEGEEWVRDKEPDSIQENTFGVDRFTDVLTAINEMFGGASLTGLRTEESPSRRLGLTTSCSYKWVTWGSKTGRKNHRLFHPIYDWKFGDIWKAIYDGDDPDNPGTASWVYNRMYDIQHRYGVPIRNMRVSNYHHETAIHSLFYLQEAEPETWEKAVKRISGINTAGHLGREDFFVKELPFMFSSWEEYYSYLVSKLVVESDQERFVKQFNDLTWRLPYVDREQIAKACVQMVLVNDYHFTKANQFYLTHRDPKKSHEVTRVRKETGVTRK